LMELVVICFKMCIFALARTTDDQVKLLLRCCDLLQNVYLCISTYNWTILLRAFLTVVICFKMCIFALARTTSQLSYSKQYCCDLLQNVYLCISTYNLRHTQKRATYVVICFKMCIFALARTTPCF